MGACVAGRALAMPSLKLHSPLNPAEPLACCRAIKTVCERAQFSTSGAAAFACDQPADPRRRGTSLLRSPQSRS